MSRYIYIGGKPHIMRMMSAEPLRVGRNRITLRFFRIRWYDRAAGVLAAFYVLARAVRR